MNRRITSHLQWRFERGCLVARSASGRWDGDEWGNEWMCGYAIHPASGAVWNLYEDDGQGNGDFLGSFANIFSAALAANAHDLQPAASITRWHRDSELSEGA